MKDEQVTKAVPSSERQSWIAVMFVWIGSMICLSSILIGSSLVAGMSFVTALVAGVVGYIIVLIITILQGMESTDLGKPTVVVSERTYGEKGTRYIFSLIIAISLIGWFGIQAQIAGETMAYFLQDIVGISVSVKLLCLILGILMLITAVYGFKMMEYFNYISVPLMIAVLLMAFFSALSQNDISMLFSYTPSSTMSMTTGLGIVVGGFIVGAVIAGDYTRFNKNRNDTIRSAGFGIVPAGIIMIVIGATLTIFSGEDDLTLVLTQYVKPVILVYIMLLLATWTTNVTNAYSAGLAIVTGLNIDGKYRAPATVIAGIGGTLLATVGILDNFTEFLSILTALVTPIAGVMIADYWIIYKGNTEMFEQKKVNGAPAIIAWIIGCIPALIVTTPLHNLLPAVIANNSILNGLSSFIGIFIAMGLYLILIKIYTPESVKERNAVTY